MKVIRLQSQALSSLFVATALAALVGACAVSNGPASTDDSATDQSSSIQKGDFCWKQTYGRGVGTIPSTCGDSDERNGALCYPSCDSGYEGAGPMCWSTCAEGYHDDGLFCRRDAVIVAANTRRCPWYDACGVALAKGCSVCPKGFANDGCTCRKDARIVAKEGYGRGAGTIGTCETGREYDAGLCYEPCGARYAGVGPVCWQSCPKGLPFACGMGCALNEAACASNVADMVAKPIAALGKIAGIAGVFAGPAVAAGAEAVKTAAQVTAALTRISGKVAEARANAGANAPVDAARAASVAAAKAAVIESARAAGKSLVGSEAVELAELLVDATVTGEFDWTKLDPTGIAAMIDAFVKPMCSAP